MVVNQEEFRTFIANADIFINNSVINPASQLEQEQYTITYFRLKAKVGDYKKQLSQENQESRWKQTKLFQE